MVSLKAALFLALTLVTFSTAAQISFCNKTVLKMEVALLHIKAGEWKTDAWYKVKPGECLQPTRTIENQYFYFYARSSEGHVWRGDSEKNDQCLIPEKMFNVPSKTACKIKGAYRVNFVEVDSGAGTTSYKVLLSLPGREFPTTKVGTIQKKCIASWSDSHQLHSVDELTITWGRQALKTTYKRLDHCIELTVTGPIDIQGLAEGFLDECVNYGINHQKTRHALELLAAIAGDVASGGATFGALTAAKIGNYASSVANETLDCLTSSDRVTQYVGNALREKFDGSVRHESHWAYY